MEGFTILKRLPLDGSGGNVKLEVRANVALPEPEIEYSTETQQRSLIGMGDVEVSIDEMNLLLDYWKTKRENSDFVASIDLVRGLATFKFQLWHAMIYLIKILKNSAWNIN